MVGVRRRDAFGHGDDPGWERGGNEVGTNRVPKRPPVSSRVIVKYADLQVITDGDRGGVLIEPPSSKPRVAGSNPARGTSTAAAVNPGRPIRGGEVSISAPPIRLLRETCKGYESSRSAITSRRRHTRRCAALKRKPHAAGRRARRAQWLAAVRIAGGGLPRRPRTVERGDPVLDRQGPGAGAGAAP
jgi:hypothetical protein